MLDATTYVEAVSHPARHHQRQVKRAAIYPPRQVSKFHNSQVAPLPRIGGLTQVEHIIHGVQREVQAPSDKLHACFCTRADCPASIRFWVEKRPVNRPSTARKPARFQPFNRVEQFLCKISAKHHQANFRVNILSAGPNGKIGRRWDPTPGRFLNSFVKNS